MKIQCDFCDNTYEDTEPQCPYCGAPNPSHHDGDNTPKTIEQLKSWYEARKLPPYEKTRFFIGIDYKKPKAFGIYKDENTGEFIVYKNKADGSRAIRYKGEDEAYAVNELLQKLKDEIVHQKALKANKGRKPKKSLLERISGAISTLVFWVGIGIFGLSFVVGVVSAVYFFFNPGNYGYYKYNDSTYYCDDYTWYQYDDGIGDWKHVYYDALPAELADSETVDDYFLGSEWDNSIDATDWNNSSYYAEKQESSDDGWDWSSDSDYDWDSGSDWDSGGTDWDSDW